MAMEIDKTILGLSIKALEAAGEYCDNLKDVMEEANQYDAGNIPYKILLSDDGYLTTKIIKEKVVLQ